MIRPFQIFTAALLLALATSHAAAAPLRTFYVDPAGNDAANGSAASSPTRR